MAIDFRANQIRVEKIISSGSSILIYPSGAASDLEGNIDPTIFPQTGFGSDVFLFVSGGMTRSGTDRNVSAFGGILVSSGTVYGLTGFSGSLTRLTDGSPYLIGSGTITITTNSNGSIEIKNESFSFNSTSVAYSGSYGLTGTSNFVFNDNTNTLKIFENEDGIEISKLRIKASDPIIDTSSKDFFINGSNAIVSGAGGSIYVYAGNSGYLEGIPNNGGGIVLNAGSGSAVTDTFFQNAGTGGSVYITSGRGGRSYGTARGGIGGFVFIKGGDGGDSDSNIGGDGSNIYIIAGNAGSGSSGSGLGGNIEITTGQPYFSFPDSDSGYLKLNVGYRTLSMSLSSASIRIDSDGYARNVIFGFDHVSVGGIPDSYFIVSGSPTRNALFMSDLISSGSIKAVAGFSGSLTQLVDGSPYLIASGGISITTESNGSIVISASNGGPSLPTGINGGVLAYSGGNWISTNSGSLGTPLVASGSGLPFYSDIVVPLRIGMGQTATMTADQAIGLKSDYKKIAVRDAGDVSWLNIWEIDGSNNWFYGNTNTTYVGDVYYQCPSNATLYLTKGSTNYLSIGTSGITVGSIFDSTSIRGSSLTIGLTNVVTLYQGGKRIPEVTINSDTYLDESHEVVFVDASATHVTASLPVGTSGRILMIQRISGSNDVVVARSGFDTIRAYGVAGNTQVTISDNTRRELIFRSVASEWVFEVA